MAENMDEGRRQLGDIRRGEEKRSKEEVTGAQGRRAIEAEGAAGPQRFDKEEVIRKTRQISQDDIVIAFMGATGTGKSTFIDLLVGQKGKRSGNDIESVTQEIEAICVIHPKHKERIILVDTPGFDDTYLTEGALLKQLALWLAKTYKANIRLSGIIYLHSITDRRMGKSSLKNLHTFNRLCGEDALQRVVLVSTMWKDVDPEDGKARENQLVEQFWQPMISKGAMVDRLETTDQEDAWRIVDRLMERHQPTTMLIQEELVKQKIKLGKTEAGKAVRRGMKDNLSDLKGQLKRLQDQKMETADPERKQRLAQQITEIENEYKQNADDLHELGGQKFWGNMRPQVMFRAMKKKAQAVPFTAITSSVTSGRDSHSSSLGSKSMGSINDQRAQDPPNQLLCFSPPITISCQDDREIPARMSGPHEAALRISIQNLLDSIPMDLTKSDTRMRPHDSQALVDYLDSVLEEGKVSSADRRNKIFNLLYQIAMRTNIYPRRVVLHSFECDTNSIDGRGFGDAHRESSQNSSVCVKVIKRQMLNKTAVKLYLQEVILWLYISHPNILPLCGLFSVPSSTGPRMCLVSPWMENGNIKSYAATLSQKDRMPLLHDVANGLLYLHELDITHGDLKSENILISDDGRALITDIGASHFLQVGPGHEFAQDLSPFNFPFSAPEVYDNQFFQSTNACDVWSFGCLCYEILSRRQPFYGYVVAHVIRALHVEKKCPERPQANEADRDPIDDEMWELILACWTFDPQARPNCHRIWKRMERLVISDNRPTAKPVEKPQDLKTVSKPHIDIARAEQALRGIQAANRARLATSHAEDK